MNNHIEKKLKEFDDRLDKVFSVYRHIKQTGWLMPIQDSVEVKDFIKQALQEQEDRVYEEERQRRKEEKCQTAKINYKAGYDRAKQEILQIVIEDVPHKYQERLLKELNI